MAKDRLPSGGTAIYGLFDPRTGHLRYVGKTVNKLSKRLLSHINHTKNAALAAWVRELGAAGSRPEIDVIEFVPTANWEEGERFWIEYFRAIGADLLNVSPGGGAVPRHPPDLLAVIAVKRAEWLADPANRERIREKSLAAWRDPAKRDRMLSAQKAAITPELRKRRSEMKARDWAENPNYRANFKAGQAEVDRAALAREFWKRPEYQQRQAAARAASRQKKSDSLKLAWARRKGTA